MRAVAQKVCFLPWNQIAGQGIEAVHQHLCVRLDSAWELGRQLLGSGASPSSPSSCGSPLVAPGRLPRAACDPFPGAVLSERDQRLGCQLHSQYILVRKQPTAAVCA